MKSNSQENTKNQSRLNRFLEWSVTPLIPTSVKEDHWYERKHWYQRQVVEITMLVTSFLVGTLPWIVSLHNGYPKSRDLETMHARILETQREDPHLLVELDDGTEMTMEFPVYISGRSSMPFYGWTKEQRHDLVGCDVDVRGVWLEWTVRERFRVWELKCPSKEIVITRAMTREQFAYARNADLEERPYLAAYLPILLILIAAIKEIIYRFKYRKDL